VLQTRIRLALARSEQEHALALSRSLDDQLDPEQASEDGAIVYLTTQMATMPGEPDDAWKIVQRAAAAKISDGAMFAVLRNLRYSRLTGVQDWEDRARASGLTPESYPIAWSWFQASTGSLEEAMRTLKSTHPSTDTDAAVCQTARQAADEDRLSRPSLEDTERQLSDMLRVLSAMPVERFPIWLRSFLLETTWRLEQRGRKFQLSRTEDLRARAVA